MHLLVHLAFLATVLHYTNFVVTATEDETITLRGGLVPTAQYVKPIQPIAKGNFGEVYIGKMVVPGNPDIDVAIKKMLNGRPKDLASFLADKTQEQQINFQRISNQLVNEKNMYDIFSDNAGIPKMHDFGHLDGEQGGKEVEFDVLVIDRLGRDLHNQVFTLKTVLLVMIETTYTLEYIHEKGYVHRDIKPANLMRGFHNPKQVFVADFGTVNTCRELVPPVGSLNYASPLVRADELPAKRDDLISLGLAGLELLYGSLPWSRLPLSPLFAFVKNKFLENIPELPEGYNKYPEIGAYFEYLKGLTYNITPNYRHVRRILLNMFHNSGYLQDGAFDWSEDRTWNFIAFSKPDGEVVGFIPNVLIKEDAGFKAIIHDNSGVLRSHELSEMKMKIHTGNKNTTLDNLPHLADETEWFEVEALKEMEPVGEKQDTYSFHVKMNIPKKVYVRLQCRNNVFITGSAVYYKHTEKPSEIILKLSNLTSSPAGDLTKEIISQELEAVSITTHDGPEKAPPGLAKNWTKIPTPLFKYISY